MPLLNSNHLSPTGQRVYTEITHTVPALAPGQAEPAALYEFAERLVEHVLAARPAQHKTSDRMAARAEKWAADCAAARAEQPAPEREKVTVTV